MVIIHVLKQNRKVKKMDRSIKNKYKNFIVKNERKLINIMFFEIGFLTALIILILLGFIDNKIIPSII
tara:strand:+ start:4187 stop:4390 length:204 start_codon:yes stop_codon:yes gene_type:complete